jgi:Pentapeptide repeats (9 copies)
VQYWGRRATSRDTRETLDRTFAEQREQLDRTLAEQREQLGRTLAEQRTRTLNERFATAAGQLGDDKPPAVRLAGVYAMAGLADDWEENRQTCVDVLCGYLRMPYEPDPGQDAPGPERLEFRASREVRHTVIRVIAAHLRKDAAVSWQGLDFDFADVVFDGGSFHRAEFSGGTVSFYDATFPGGTVYFGEATFSGGTVYFGDAWFSDGTVTFGGATFSGDRVTFHGAAFSGGMVTFGGAWFSAARSISPLLATGRTRRCSTGQTRRRQA